MKWIEVPENVWSVYDGLAAEQLLTERPDRPPWSWEKTRTRGGNSIWRR